MGQVNQDENALQFDASEAEDFRALRDFVQSKIEKGGESKPVSVADELAKLATLREQGILTDEEFAEQKTRLLSS